MPDERCDAAGTRNLIDERKNGVDRRCLGTKTRVLGKRCEPREMPRALTELPHRFRHPGMVAALKPVGEDEHDRTACDARKARLRQESLERGADPRAAVPVFDPCRRLAKRKLSVASLQRPGNAGQPGPEGESFD